MLGQTPVVGPNSGPVNTPPTDAQTAKAEISTLPPAATATVPPVDASAPAAAVPSNILDAVAEVLDRTEPTTTLDTDLQLRQKISSDDLDAFSLLGVRLSYFDTFIDEWCAGREKLDGWTTTDVCEKVVKPRTTKSVCDQLVEETSSAVGRATWFISHAWKYEFLDVVDAVKHHFETSNPDVIVWFDLFSNSQHDTAAKPFPWWTGTFTNAISELGSVLMILHPWNNPITLGRAWCVFELYACTNTKSNFAIALPPRHTSDFRTSLRDNPGEFYKMLATINSAKSVAFKDSDRDAIHAAIREKVGFSALDRMVLSLLSNWMVSTLHSHILLTEKAGDDVEHAKWLSSLADLFQDQGRYKDAEPLFVDCLERFRRVLGEDHPDTLKSISNLAVLYQIQGKYGKAEALQVDCLERRRLVLGEDHPNTLESISNLGVLYEIQGEYEKAEPLQVDCLERRRLVLGEDHPNTLGSINNLAVLYGNQGKSEEAEPLLVECLERRRRVLGEDHPETLWSINGLASLYHGQGEYGNGKAEPLYVGCLERQRRVLGEDHPDTLWSINNLAVFYDDQRKREKAEQLYVDCLERRRRVLGEDHEETFLSIHNLAVLCNRLGKYEKAGPLYVECLERRRRVLGEDHEETLKSIENLAGLYYRQGKYEKAEPLWVDCLERMRRVLGEAHPSTQAVRERLASLRAEAEE
ncbi:Kinesin light chain 3 [Borealophlyctis nickersoniae]|nr:Kinesin light chain 3 [Borealophlyctis nickersoniae]